MEVTGGLLGASFCSHLLLVAAPGESVGVSSCSGCCVQLLTYCVLEPLSSDIKSEGRIEFNFLHSCSLSVSCISLGFDDETGSLDSFPVAACSLSGSPALPTLHQVGMSGAPGQCFQIREEKLSKR